MALSYPAVSMVGSLLPGGVIERIGEGDPDVPGTDPQSYELLAGESVRRLANTKFAYLRESYAEYNKRRGPRRGGRRNLDEWLAVLLRELQYGQVDPLPQGISVDGKSFPVSHSWQHAIPVHLVPWGSELDSPIGGIRPHSLVQRLLNQSNEYLWGLLSNGQRFRVLRNSTSLVASAYLEFDLQAIFEGELFPDFVLLYRMVHASRLRVRDKSVGMASCLLEEWRAYGARQGERALSRLRGGVAVALEILGTGFLDHPGNTHLRAAVNTGLSLADIKRALLRLVYKLIFWMTVEDRDALLIRGVDPAAKRRYEIYLSSRRLRNLAGARRYSRHHDLWEATKLVFAILGSETGSPLLGLPGLGGIFEPSPLDEPLCGALLTNGALLQAVEALSILTSKHSRRQLVDWRHLGAEELGSVYEALLELHPRWDPDGRQFSFDRHNGNDRKKAGAYYTPISLVEQLLDSTLEPLLDEACAADAPTERIRALLDITVCDPACGSGTFLVHAARRIARRLAIEEEDDPEPSRGALQKALRTVVSRCVHGVDINEMAVELAKISLWLEAIEPGKPLGYLDGNIRVGNALLGATPSLLRGGLPDTAFVPLEGDDKRVVTALRRQNATERGGARPFVDAVDVATLDLAAEARAIAHLAPCETLADVHVQARRGRALDVERLHKREIADAWCSAFVAPKTQRTRPYALTHSMLDRISRQEQGKTVDAARQIVELMVRQYRFFHWHLEFPHIFPVPEEENASDERTDGRRGFSCVLTNPPWERVKLQEQEFFATRDPKIANAANAATRKDMIAALATNDHAESRDLHAAWIAALRGASGTSHLLRTAGRHPFTGRGDINTYSVFAETSRAVLNSIGQLGIILPTGIATDATTQDFFKDLVKSRSLVSLHDFENEKKIFTDVHHLVRFCLLCVSGANRPSPHASLAFRLHRVDQIASHAYTLTPDEITQLNPNTGTCPVFRSRRDTEISLDVYRRIPVLWREGDPNGNPWAVRFMAMLHMANDSRLFQDREKLTNAGWRLVGNVFVRNGVRMVPLYEAKMLHYFDHRYGTYEGSSQAQLNVGTLARLDETARRDPNYLAMPNYWVNEQVIEDRLGDKWSRGWLLGWRDVCRTSDERTLIASVLPRVAVGHKFLVAFPQQLRCGLHANLSTMMLDYLARQKLSGTSMSYFVIKQLPVLPPERYGGMVPWDSTVASLDQWISRRVLELSYTTHDMAPYAKDLGDNGPPFRWDPARRESIRSELDAAYFHLYSVERDDVKYVMSTFNVIRDRDQEKHGEYRTERLVLERYDAMAEGVRQGNYRTPLDPQPGDGPRNGRIPSRRTPVD